jgi:hypothetical protein
MVCHSACVRTWVGDRACSGTCPNVGLQRGGGVVGLCTAVRDLRKSVAPRDAWVCVCVGGGGIYALCVPAKGVFVCVCLCVFVYLCVCVGGGG